MARRLTDNRLPECDGCGDTLVLTRINTRGFIGRETHECEDCRRLRIVMKRANRPRIGMQSASEELKRELG